ncbi:hypothetical protein D3C80_1874990 [compost metagenome]
MHRDHQPLAPAQMQQALGMVGVVVGLENAVETAWRKTFGQVGQTAVDQPALIATLDQRAARQTAPACIVASPRTGDTFAAIDRNLPRITGTQQCQAHADCSPRQASSRSTVRSNEPELSST